ncbi:coiled-coil domain-containing protein 66-like isoform X2 [Oscarella lobularis]|uniref:coiled-coil domain-containing protein 66-like isoform X2 n=1 Tax=Oscarella lobularis TaxID=121494 RepID=UPI003313D165
MLRYRSQNERSKLPSPNPTRKSSARHRREPPPRQPSQAKQRPVNSIRAHQPPPPRHKTLKQLPTDRTESFNVVTMDELQKILRLTQKSNDVVPVHVKSRSKAVFEKTSSPLPVTETVTEVKTPVISEDGIFFPFGSSGGGGAPLRTDSGHLLTDYKSRRGLATILSGESDHVISLGASGDRGKREKRTVPAVQDEITPAPSFRLNVPRAMRSSLTFGTSFVPEEDKAAADKRQWLRELEKQVKEKRQRRDTWGPPPPPPPRSLNRYKELPAINSPTARPVARAMRSSISFGTASAPAEDTSVQDRIRWQQDLAQQVEDRRQSQASSLSPPLSTATGSVQEMSSFHRNHSRLLDPGALSELGKKKMRDQEHHAFIQRQIEERQLLKQKERELRARQQAEEEARVAKERAELHEKWLREQEAVKKKEEEARKRAEHFENQVLLAKQAALQEKRDRLTRHAQKRLETVQQDRQALVEPPKLPSTEEVVPVSAEHSAFADEESKKPREIGVLPRLSVVMESPYSESVYEKAYDDDRRNESDAAAAAAAADNRRTRVLSSKHRAKQETKRKASQTQQRKNVRYGSGGGATTQRNDESAKQDTLKRHSADESDKTKRLPATIIAKSYDERRRKLSRAAAEEKRRQRQPPLHPLLLLSPPPMPSPPPPLPEIQVRRKKADSVSTKEKKSSSSSSLSSSSHRDVVVQRTSTSESLSSDAFTVPVHRTDSISLLPGFRRRDGDAVDAASRTKDSEVTLRLPSPSLDGNDHADPAPVTRTVSEVLRLTRRYLESKHREFCDGAESKQLFDRPPVYNLPKGNVKVNVDEETRKKMLSQIAILKQCILKKKREFEEEMMLCNREQ